MITICPHCGTITEIQSVTETMYCPECGFEYKADSFNTTTAVGTTALYVAFGLFLLISGMNAIGFIAVPGSLSQVIFTVLTFAASIICLASAVSIERSAEEDMILRQLELFRHKCNERDANGACNGGKRCESGNKHGR